MLIRATAVAVFLASLATTPSNSVASDLETTICGALKERMAFALWSSYAGRSTISVTSMPPTIQDTPFQTQDGRVLRGFRVCSAACAGPANSALLILQGDATLAEKLLDLAQELVSADEVDVFVFDYRGYGRSDGARRLKAIVSDSRQIITMLQTTHDKLSFYAMSFGGIVFLKASTGLLRPVDRVVLDSVPSDIGQYGCPNDYSPLSNVPVDARNVLFVSGATDTVVKPAQTAALRAAIVSAGGKDIVLPSAGHPIMEDTPESHRERMLDLSNWISQ